MNKYDPDILSHEMSVAHAAALVAEQEGLTGTAKALRGLVEKMARISMAVDSGSEGFEGGDCVANPNAQRDIG